MVHALLLFSPFQHNHIRQRPRRNLALSCQPESRQARVCLPPDACTTSPDLRSAVMPTNLLFSTATEVTQPLNTKSPNPSCDGLIIVHNFAPAQKNRHNCQDSRLTPAKFKELDRIGFFRKYRATPVREGWQVTSNLGLICVHLCSSLRPSAFLFYVRTTRASCVRPQFSFPGVTALWRSRLSIRIIARNRVPPASSTESSFFHPDQERPRSRQILNDQTNPRIRKARPVKQLPG